MKEIRSLGFFFRSVFVCLVIKSSFEINIEAACKWDSLTLIESSLNMILQLDNDSHLFEATIYSIECVIIIFQNKFWL